MTQPQQHNPVDPALVQFDAIAQAMRYARAEQRTVSVWQRGYEFAVWVDYPDVAVPDGYIKLGTTDAEGKWFTFT